MRKSIATAVLVLACVAAVGLTAVPPASATGTTPGAPQGPQLTIGSNLNNPAGVTVDSEGNVYIADEGNSRVEEVAPDGAQTTIGSGFDYPIGMAIDRAATSMWPMSERTMYPRSRRAGCRRRSAPGSSNRSGSPLTRQAMSTWPISGTTGL